MFFLPELFSITVLSQPARCSKGAGSLVPRPIFRHYRTAGEKYSFDCKRICIILAHFELKYT